MNKQLELFPEKIKKTKSVITRQSNSNHFREWNDVMASIAKNFSVSDSKYFAGMVDGDGSFPLHTRKDRLNPTSLIAGSIVNRIDDGSTSIFLGATCQVCHIFPSQ